MSTLPWQTSFFDAQSIGWALLHSLWQIGAVGLLLAVILRLLRGASPALRYGIALTGLLAMVLWPAMSLRPAPDRTLPPQMVEARVIPAAEVVGETPSEPKLIASPREKSPSSSIVASSTPSQQLKWSRWELLLRPWLPRATWAWVACVLALCCWRGLGWLQLKRWARLAQPPADLAWQQRVDSLLKRMRVSRGVQLLTSDNISAPLAMGLFRPLILFPVQLLTNLSANQIEALLAHELAHLRRQNYLVNLMQTVVETLLFYHPVIWWVNRVIRQERELCCDDLVVSQSENRQDYILALAKTAEWQQESRSFAPASNGGNVLARLQRLLNQRPTQGNARGTGVALLLLLGMLTLVPIVKAALDKPSRGRLLDRNGVVLAETQADGVRRYPWGSLAAHVLGQSSRIKPDAAGLEASQNEALAKGQDVKLELDVRMQLIVEQVLREAKIGRGAVVLLDPRDGSVRAMASVPNYDPNAFSGSVEKGLMRISNDDYKKLQADLTSPLLNRAISAYTPGSVFKLVGAVTAVKSGLANKHYSCAGSFEIDKRNFACWVRGKGMNGHGDLDLEGAIKTSCNCYFYQLGIELGSDKIYDTAKLLGFDGATGIELPGERTGLVVSDSHRHDLDIVSWTKAKTANIVIGQGEAQASPLQIASMTTALANGGTVWLPRVVKGVPMEREESHGAFTKEMLDPVRKGMWELVHGAVGAGKRAKSEIIEIAGMPGTAQGFRHISGKSQPVPDNITWFTGFAPYETPRFAIAVMVQNGTAGGATCAPIVKRILEQVSQLADKATPPSVEAQPVIQGHFEPVENVSFE